MFFPLAGSASGRRQWRVRIVALNRLSLGFLTAMASSFFAHDCASPHLTHFHRGGCEPFSCWTVPELGAAHQAFEEELCGVLGVGFDQKGGGVADFADPKILTARGWFIEKAELPSTDIQYFT